eukprot:5099361-Alexandrium_andersonii.AAC.1
MADLRSGDEGKTRLRQLQYNMVDGVVVSSDYSGIGAEREILMQLAAAMKRDCQFPNAPRFFDFTRVCDKGAIQQK